MSRPPQKRIQSEVNIDGVMLIPLTQGKHAIVDIDEYEKLMRWNWCAQYVKNRNHWRAVRGEWDGFKNKIIYMHREIMCAPDGLLVDHRDGNGLNNLKSNLRLATHSQNLHNIGPRNRSGAKGVYWCKNKKKWTVRIKVDNINKNLGYFEDKQHAINVYKEAALKYHGEFARFEPFRSL